MLGALTLVGVGACAVTPDPVAESDVEQTAEALRTKPRCGQVCHHRRGGGHCHRDCMRDCRCPAPYSDCDGQRSNGCETDTSTDLANCGECGNVCPVPSHSSAATCVAGECGFTCDVGWADCDGDPSNGCEVDIANDPTQCGACGNACPAPPNATAACAASQCIFTCGAGFADCDRQPANGCEVSTTENPLHCGGCWLTCRTSPNTVSSCTAGTCSSSCVAGYSNCDADAANGCETIGACSPIACTTQIINYNTGNVTRTIVEPNVAIEWGSSTAEIVLLSEGVRQALWGTTYLSLVRYPTGEFIGSIPYGDGLPGHPPTQVHASVTGNEATLAAFTHTGRPFMSTLVRVTCAAGATTILP